MNKYSKLVFLVTLFFPFYLLPQAVSLYQTDFPPEEYQTRWDKLFDRIGDNAIAIIQGSPESIGSLFRQSNQFYYLCGIETPHSYLLLDGKNRRVTLYLPHATTRKTDQNWDMLLSSEEGEEVKILTGVDAVLPTDKMANHWARYLYRPPAPVIYTPFSPAVSGGHSRDSHLGALGKIYTDPWDSRVSREGSFIQLLKVRFPTYEIRDLSPILDELRTLKSPKEIELLRRAAQLSGLAIMEAIRCSEPGVYEYQLEAAARYIFQINGARREGYSSITASGSNNIWMNHYSRASGQLNEGDLVLMDYAPDYRYYTSDIGRMWPVNGKFSKQQRELCQFVLDYHKTILKYIRPGVSTDRILKDTASEMEDVITQTGFSKPIYKQAAQKLVDTGGGALSHPVGMAVHDVGNYKSDVLKQGTVFALDPQMWIPEEKLYIRIEDTVLITEDGVENFMDFVPSELGDIEKLMKEKGILQKRPPVSAIK